MIKLNYDYFGRTEPSQIFLARPARQKICLLNGIEEDSVSLNLKLKDISTISFTVNKYIDGTLSNGYDLLDVNMEIYVTGIGWFKLEVPSIQNDGFNESKEITANSIEIELQQTNLIGFKVNYATPDSMEVLNGGTQIKFYDSDNPKLSLLHLVMEEVKGWSIGYVDTELKDKIYYFDIDSKNRYAFLTQDVSSAYECLFVFDIDQFTVNAYDVNAMNTLNRAPFKDTNIFLSFRNIQNNVNISKSSDDLYTVYNVAGGEDLNINYVNFGSSTIEDLSYYTNTKYMSQDLIDKYTNWFNYKETQREPYIETTTQYNKLQQQITELTNRVPNDGCNTDWSTFSDEELKTEKEAYITAINNIFKLYDYGKYTIDEEKNEKVYEYDSNGFIILKPEYQSEDKLKDKMLEDGCWYTYWQYRYVIYESIIIEEQNRLLEDPDDEKEYIDSWETNWDLFGRDELENKVQAYKNQISTLKKNGFDSPYTEDSNFTEPYHTEMYQKYQDTVKDLESCELALSERKKEIEELTEKQKEHDSLRQEIKSNIEKTNEKFGFTTEDLQTLYALYNEIDYVNENIISTSLDDIVSVIEVEKSLLNDALESLSSASQPQLSYSNNVDNLLALSDYKPVHMDFQLGNFVRLAIDDTHQVKLRIMSLSFNPCIMGNDLNIEFSNMVRSRNKYSDLADILSKNSNQKANSIIGTSYSSGGEVLTVTSDMIAKILNSSQFNNFTNDLIAQTITANGIKAGTITVEELKAKLAQIDQLEANSAFINYLNAMYLVANQAGFNELSALVANIKQAIIGTSTTETGIIINLTSENAKIDSLLVREQIAGQISVSDLKAGDITLSNNMRILSENGKLVMNGSLLQVLGKDSSGEDYVAIQLGYDTTNNPSLIIRNENNAVILSPTGITKEAIADGLIDNSMIGDKQISTDKLSFNITTDEDGNVIQSIENIYMGNGEKFGVEYTTFKKNTEDKQNQLEQQIEDNLEYDIEIHSTNGNIFKNGEINTILSCHVYRSNVEITDQINAAHFKWIKKNKNGELDKEWNAVHASGSKTVSITSDDVFQRATFECHVENITN